MQGNSGAGIEAVDAFGVDCDAEEGCVGRSGTVGIVKGFIWGWLSTVEPVTVPYVLKA